jgi:hypothetical protein
METSISDRSLRKLVNAFRESRHNDWVFERQWYKDVTRVLAMGRGRLGSQAT